MDLVGEGLGCPLVALLGAFLLDGLAGLLGHALTRRLVAHVGVISGRKPEWLRVPTLRPRVLRWSSGSRVPARAVPRARRRHATPAGPARTGPDDRPATR